MTAQAPPRGPGRYDFAEQLRGPAAMSVVLAHYLGVFWVQHRGVAAIIGARPLEALPQPGPVWAAIQSATVFLGEFGVGVFFAISGFVIPLALEREGTASFLGRRVFRIFPAYVAGLSVAMVAVWLTSTSVGRPFPYDPGEILAQMTILPRALLGSPRIDAIAWTLEVELAFYIVAAVLAFRLVRGGLPVIAALAFVLAVGTLAIAGTSVQRLTGVEVACGLNILAGYAVFLREKGRLNAPQYAMALAICLGAAAVLWAFPLTAAGFSWQWFAGLWSGTAIFIGAHAARHRFGAFAIGRKLAAISYPLYTVHSMTGYAVIHAVMAAGGSPALACATALVTATLLATLIARLIEQPGIRLGRRIFPASTGLRNREGEPE